MKEDGAKIIEDFKNCNIDAVASAVHANACNTADDSFESRRSQQELDKWIKGALYILNKMEEEET